ncbi:hypothetical protein ACFVY1_35125 [Streptomyces sp. NPDC058293]|uniref:hypothetical protein n=1 Tax=Streptomyces sp. NPDC058293 TaxID=3346429 RepID=UPI0036E9A3B7
MNSGAVSTGVETTAMNPAPTQPVIKVQDVSFGYGEKTIINRVSFEAQEGEFLSLIGPFGFGKRLGGRVGEFLCGGLENDVTHGAVLCER